MDEKEYKDCLKRELLGQFKDQNLTVLDQFSFKQILLNALREQQIDFDEALRLNKILKSIMQYNTLDDMFQYEDIYYTKFRCKNELDKINLEIGYLKAKLLGKYNARKDKQGSEFDVDETLLSLEKIEKMLLVHTDDDNFLSLIKEKIILLELKLNIEIKFLGAAHEYFKNKIYSLHMK